MRRLLNVTAAAALAWACTKAPPDPDATPAGASALELGTTHEDSLACAQKDCADWYRVQLPSGGKLEVQLRQQAPGPSGRVSLTLTDAQGQTLARDDAAGRTQLTLRQAVRAGDYLVAVVSDDMDNPVSYSLFTFFNPDPAPAPAPKKREPPPKPAPKPVPQVEIRRGEVLEVRDGGTVLLDLGASQGLRTGMRGRLLANGKPIAKVEVLQVFSDGCVARVSDGAPGVGATAEIELR
jgi:hypothetical protein